MKSHNLQEFFLGSNAHSTLFRLSAAGMKHVPRRSLLLVTTAPRIVVTKAIEHPIPNRHELADHHGFPEGNPDVIDDQIPAREVGELQIGGLLDRLRVLTQAPKKHLAWSDIEAESALPRASRH